jgi:site-specific DNA recombinase
MERIVRKVMPFPQPVAWIENKHIYQRVAVYARVSTSKNEQLESVEAQKDYYTKYISGRTDWIFSGLYSDQGLSGTSYNKRKEFNQMITGALSGKFDLIITKSISRFARNTVDALKTTRKLKAHGVEVYFENINPNTA